MNTVLQQINTIQGMIGSLVCDDQGTVISHVFPPIFDIATLQDVAGKAQEIALGLNEGSGGVDMVDLRYTDGRVLIKKMPKGFLLLLCANTINIQMLKISLNVTLSKLSVKLKDYVPAPSPPAPGTAPEAAAAPKLRKNNKGVILLVDSLSSSSKVLWNQMEENVAISRGLSDILCKIYSVPACKKLLVTSKANGLYKSFNVIVFDNGAAETVDDKIIFTLAASEAIKVKPDDEVYANAAINSGIFGGSAFKF